MALSRLRVLRALLTNCGAPLPVAVFGLCLLLSGATAHAAKWDPVDPADLAAKESTAFPGADVEFLQSRHVMKESAEGRIAGTMMSTSENSLVSENYMRAKVYTQKGVGDLGKFAILFHSSRKAVGTAARVVKPDGTSVELKKSDIFESVRAKTRTEGEMKQITFVFPGLESGDVVEFRWTEQLGEALWLETFYCQETLPVREYHFEVGSLQGRGTVSWRNCPNAETSDKDIFEIKVRNIPAFEEEEHMPPMRDFRGAIFVAKTFPFWSTDKEVWKELSSYWGNEFNMAARPSGPIKKKAAELVVGATTDAEKLARLYEFCQGQIFNTSYKTTVDLQADIDKHKDESAQSPVKTLEKGRGRADEIDMLFASLARGLGYEARLAYNASREHVLDVMVPQGWAFIHDMSSVAVKVGEQWVYYHPGNYLLPCGLLAAEAEGSRTLLCDTKKLEYGSTPVSGADRNRHERKGRFTLDAEGTLEGSVEEVFLGHEATSFKADNWEKTLEDVKKNYRDAVNKRLPNAEVSDIEWTNLESRQLPLTVKYKVRVPGYAEQMGKRLVFSPAFFENGESVTFAAVERKFPVFFLYPWVEQDDIEIVLPEGYTLDKASAPQPVGDLKGAFGSSYKLQYNGKTRTFGYRRDFSLGGNGAFVYRTESYPALKNLFEQLHKSDTHSIMLKPKVAPADPVPASAPAPAPADAAPAQP
jgi:hypothetical protein